MLLSPGLLLTPSSRSLSIDNLVMADVKWIPVLPKNHRRIALYAIETAEAPKVLVNGKRETDFSETGPLTQKRIRGLRDFEILDGDVSILGFHDHPREMWITEDFATLAMYCQAQGWLKIQRSSS